MILQELPLQQTMLEHQIGIGLMTSYGLEILKKAGTIPWIRQDTEKLNRWLSIIMAFLTSVGLQFASEHNPTTGGWIITIAVPSVPVIWDTLVHATLQYGIQHTAYKGLLKPVQELSKTNAAGGGQ